METLLRRGVDKVRARLVVVASAADPRVLSRVRTVPLNLRLSGIADAVFVHHPASSRRPSLAHGGWTWRRAQYTLIRNEIKPWKGRALSRRTLRHRRIASGLPPTRRARRQFRFRMGQSGTFPVVPPDIPRRAPAR